MPLSQLSVILVDAEPSFAEMAKGVLERLGQARVTTVASAQEAMTMMVDVPFDAVVSAYQMPDMNGIDFLKALRGRGNDVPFIMLTGKGSEDVAILALNEGADYYLKKGGESQEVFADLAHKIRRSIERREAERDLKESENRLRRAEEVSQTGHFQINIDTGLVTGSAGAMGVYGVDSQSFPLSVVEQMTLPEYRPMLDKAFDAMVERGEPYNVRYKIRRPKDGRIVDIHSVAEYDPKTRTVFGIAHDFS